MSSLFYNTFGKVVGDLNYFSRLSKESSSKTSLGIVVLDNYMGIYSAFFLFFLSYFFIKPEVKILETVFFISIAVLFVPNLLLFFLRRETKLSIKLEKVLNIKISLIREKVFSKEALIVFLMYFLQKLIAVLSYYFLFLALGPFPFAGELILAVPLINILAALPFSFSGPH